MRSNKITLKQMKMDTVSPATRLLDKRRLMYQVQEAFERQKEEEKRREEIFRSKEAELRARDLAIQEKLIQFHKIIQEYEAKRQRAKNRIDEERRAINMRTEKLNDLSTKLEELKSRQKDLAQQVREKKAYEEFLEKVRRSNQEDYADILDILSLYYKLEGTNHQLKSQLKDLEEESQRLRAQKNSLEKKKKDDILQLNIDIAKMSKKYEKIEVKRHDLTKQVDLSSAGAIDNTLQIGHVLMAIDNLYRRCQEGPRINHAKDFREGASDEISEKAKYAVKKLKVIRAYMNDYRVIVEEAPKSILPNCPNAKRLLRMLQTMP